MEISQKYKHELSYVPADKNKKYQRGSTPNQTMFYGILSDTNDTQLVGCLGEICDCLREPNPQDGEYYAMDCSRNYIVVYNYKSRITK